MSTSSTLMQSKVKSPQELAKTISQLKSEGKVVVHAHGVFDLVHPGHVRHLSAARQEGDVLVVTITPDRFVNKGPDRPVFNEKLRAEFLSSLELVDYVAINTAPTAIELLQLIQPSIYIKGSDYREAEKDITGGIARERDAVESVGGKLVFTDEVTFSSSHLLNSHFSLLTESAEQHLREFRENHHHNEIFSYFDKISNLKILVIGDVILDEYVFCQVLGRSSKASSLNTQFLNKELHAGGILAITNHLSDFCSEQSLITALSHENSYEEFVRSHLKDGVTPHFAIRPNGPTTLKRRFVDPFMNQKMFELSFVDNQPLPEQESQELVAHVESIIEDYDLVLVADFGHGLIDQRLIDCISSKSKFLALNVQTNSANTGYNLITKYPHADYICIDQDEIRLAYRDKYGPIEPLIEQVAEDLSAKIVTVTLGTEGSLIYNASSQSWTRTPVFSHEVVDTTGAGDAFLSLTSPLAALGAPTDIIGVVGNSAGALAVKVLGNKEATQKVALQKYLVALLA